MKCVGENAVVVGVDFSHGHDRFVHLLFDDFVVGQLLSQHSHCRLKSAHFIFIVCFGLVKFTLQDIQLFSQHVIFMFVDIEICQSLLVNAVDSFEFFGLDSELNSGLGQIPIKLSLEISLVNHHLIVLSGFLFQLS